MKWYDKAVFYHIYPLGLCGSAHENTGVREEHFDRINAWAEHAGEMGCTGIYIGPLFESEGHGYETRDYRKVDSRLGTNEDMTEFVKNCHERGQKVIVDGVFNHVGRTFFAFQDLLENRENSQYKDWFCNVNFGGNNEYNDGLCYENWGGYNLLVKLNLRNSEVVSYLLDSVDGWIKEFDIDGIRLDAADVLDFDFMKQLRHFTNEKKADFWLMGEVIHGDYSRWANQEMLDSVTNYELHKGFFSGHNDKNYFEIAHSIKRLLGICGATRLYTFVDNHDVSRIASKLKNRQDLLPVTILNYTVYGIPSVYYGSEFAIEGEKQNGADWNLRPCLNLEQYPENNEQKAIFELCSKLGKLKQEYSVLSEGEYQELVLTNRQFAYARKVETECMVIALNCDDAPAVYTIPVPISAANCEELLKLEGVEAVYENGQLQVTIPEHSGGVFYLK